MNNGTDTIIDSRRLDLPSRWPHRIAALLAVLVFPLIWLGGMVTTADAGMAVPDWPGTYGYNMFLYPIETWLFGPFDLMVEHGHRLLASFSGLVAIVLVIATFRTESRNWVRWFSVALLALIIFQGLLGGFRVLMDARTLAKIHGCVGPTFFASVTAFCVVTSRWWTGHSKTSSLVNAAVERGVKTKLLSRFAILLLLTSTTQLVFGAIVRHVAIDSPPRVFRGMVVLHVLVAIFLVIGTIIQWFMSRKPSVAGTGIRASVNTVAILVTCQFLLGLGTWVVKWGWPVWFVNYDFAASFVVGEKTFLQMNLITAHVAVGSLILAFWTIHALRCLRVDSLVRSESS